MSPDSSSVFQFPAGGRGRLLVLGLCWVVPLLVPCGVFSAEPGLSRGGEGSLRKVTPSVGQAESGFPLGGEPAPLAPPVSGLGDAGLAPADALGADGSGGALPDQGQRLDSQRIQEDAPVGGEGGAEGGSGMAGSSGEGFRLKLGVFEVRPLLSSSVVYDDNILIASSNEESDVIFIVSPGVDVGVGDSVEKKESFLQLTYSPSFLLYADRTDLNAVNQMAGLNGQYGFNRLSLGGGVQWENSFTTTNRDIGGRVEQSVLLLSLRAGYKLGERSSLEANGQFLNRDVELGVDARDYVGRLWFVYSLTSKLDASVGAAFGHLEAADQPGQPYQQLLLRARYESTRKLSFSSSAGVEFRQFDSGRSSRTTPVFDVTGNWQPVDSLLVSLTAYRRVTSSAALVEENFTSTGVSLLGRQRVIGGLSLELSGGYEQADYSAAGDSSATVGRQDDYAYSRAALLYALPKWGQVSVFHLYRNNDSSFANFSFGNRQTGLEWRVAF
jgi:hypothetical protein